LASREWSCRDAGQRGTNPEHLGKSGTGGNPTEFYYHEYGNQKGLPASSIAKD